jgi:hypothetical protein
MNSAVRKKNPRAPSMALDEAVARVQKAYDKEQLRAAPTDAVAQSLGYKGANNGSALSALASLRYYGLMERPKDGHLAVSKEFERFKSARSAPQRQAALIGFLKKPQLYAQLLEKYESGLPSDADLRAEMIQRGFNAAAAESALATFRRSVDFAGMPLGEAVVSVLPASGVIAPSRLESRASVEPMVPNEPPAPVPQPPHFPIASPNNNDNENADRIPIRLPGNRRAWLVIPTPFFEADKARLKAQIDLLLTQDEEDEL